MSTAGADYIFLPERDCPKLIRPRDSLWPARAGEDEEEARRKAREDAEDKEATIDYYYDYYYETMMIKY